ncbi:hypothetical protein [Burkholderia phage BCSR5]|nr:hypothetical protein [Burkholderia phage BCSR5]
MKDYIWEELLAAGEVLVFGGLSVATLALLITDKPMHAVATVLVGVLLQLCCIERAIKKKE